MSIRPSTFWRMALRVTVHFSGTSWKTAFETERVGLVAGRVVQQVVQGDGRSSWTTDWWWRPSRRCSRHSARPARSDSTPTSPVKLSYFASSRPLGVLGIGCAPAIGAPDVTRDPVRPVRVRDVPAEVRKGQPQARDRRQLDLDAGALRLALGLVRLEAVERLAVGGPLGLVVGAAEAHPVLGVEQRGEREAVVVALRRLAAGPLEAGEPDRRFERQRADVVAGRSGEPCRLVVVDVGRRVTVRMRRRWASPRSSCGPAMHATSPVMTKRFGLVPEVVAAEQRANGEVLHRPRRERRS